MSKYLEIAPNFIPKLLKHSYKTEKEVKKL